MAVLSDDLLKCRLSGFARAFDRFSRLVARVGGRLPNGARRAFHDEDVALGGQPRQQPRSVVLIASAGHSIVDRTDLINVAAGGTAWNDFRVHDVD